MIRDISANFLNKFKLHKAMKLIAASQRHSLLVLDDSDRKALLGNMESQPRG